MKTVLIWLAIFGVIALLFLPYAILYLIINKKQRKYFTLIAEKYNFEKHLGKQKFFKAFPLIEGLVNNHWTYVQATKSKGFTQAAGGRSNLPVTKIGVKLNNPKFTNFKVSRIKKVKKNTQEIPVEQFDDYFKLELKHYNVKEVQIGNDFKKVILKYAVKFRFDYIFLEKDYIVSGIYAEFTKEKYYEEALLRIELQHEIVQRLIILDNLVAEHLKQTDYNGFC